eukprot:gene10142-10300_t
MVDNTLLPPQHHGAAQHLYDQQHHLKLIASRCLRQRLRKYMLAHAEWRERQEMACSPIAAADTWAVLEHEERVLDFITNLTISVHANLLKRHRQPAGTSRTSLPPTFGSRAARFTGSVPPVQQQAACSGRRDESLAALGKSLDTAAVQMLRQQRQQRKKPKERHVPVFVVPAPVCTKSSDESANVGTQDTYEALRGWDMQPSG